MVASRKIKPENPLRSTLCDGAKKKKKRIGDLKNSSPIDMVFTNKSNGKNISSISRIFIANLTELITNVSIDRRVPAIKKLCMMKVNNFLWNVSWNLTFISCC